MKDTTHISRVLGRNLLQKGMVAVVLASLLVGVAPTTPAGAATTVPKLLNYQARITDDSGVPVPDGNLNIWISVYTTDSGSSCVYAMRGNCGTPSFKNVTVTNGVFSTLIGDTVSGDNAIPDSLFDTDALFLGVTVASDTEMVPRKRITTAPYALNADRLDDLDVTSSGSDTASVVALTQNGNLVVTGDPQGSSVSNGSLYINPASASASETLFGIADNATLRWSLDKEGDVTHTGSLLATAASTTASFIYRGAASQTLNIFEVQDSIGNKPLQVSATGTTITDLVITGACTGCGGGASTLQEAYAGSSATGSEIYLDSTRGALTIADSFSSFDGNLFEIQDRTNGAGDWSQRYFSVSATNTLIGGLTASSSSTHSITPNARIAGNLTPTTDATFDLGDYNRRWRDLWLSGGSANIAYDTSGTSVMKFGFETSQGLRGVIRTPTGIPLQLRSGLGTTNGGLYIDGSNNVGFGTTPAISQLHVPGKVPTAAVGSVAAGTGPQGVFVQGRYAYVAGYSDDTFRIFDVSNPASPVQVSATVSGSDDEINYITVHGRYAYITSYGGNRLRIWDVANPAAPVSVGSVAVGFKSYTHYVQGRYAYVSNAEGNSLRIFDVSNPTAPTFVSEVATGGTTVGVFVQGQFAYVAVYGSNLLKVINIANPSKPIEVGSVATGANPSTVHVQGRYAYVTNFGGDTFQIFDVSNPASPVSVATVAAGDGVSGVVVQGRYAYVANYFGSTLQVFDVSNPASPVSVGTVATGTNPRNTIVQGRYAYLVNFTSNTLQIFDIGGSYIQQFEAGGIETGTLSARNGIFAAEGSFSGGLIASGGLKVSNAAAIDFHQLYSTAVTTPTITQSAFSIDRQLTTNASFASTLTVSGALATIADYATQTTGTITSTADVLRVSQNYASNSGAALNVTTAGTGFALRVNDDGTMTDSTPLVVAASGNVGIGTASPQTKFEVVGDTNTVIARAPTSTSYSSFRAYNDQNSALRALEMGYSGSAFSGPVVTGGISGESAYVTSTGAFPLQFGTGNAYRMGITSTGNVGIGDATPDVKLSVLGGDLSVASDDTTLRSISLSADGGARGTKPLRLSFSDGQFADDELRFQASSLGVSAFAFQDTSGGGDTAQPRVAVGYDISSVPSGLAAGSLIVSGNVGVGTTTVSEKLFVSGNVGLAATGGQFRAFNEDTVKLKHTNWYASNSDQWGQGQLYNELWFGAISANSVRRIGFYLDLPNAGSSDSGGSATAHPTNARMYIDTSGVVVPTGNVGIGAPSAGHLLEVSGALPRIQITATTNDNNAGLRYTAKDSGGTSRNAGIYYKNSGAGVNSYLGFSADDVTYQLTMHANGNVGMGNLAPANRLTVGSATSTFEVDHSGNLIKVNNVPYSWPSSQGGTSTVLQNNGSGTLSWASASGLVNLQQAYAASSATGSEIYLDGTRGALTIADSFSSFGGNLFEIQDRTNGAGDYSQRYFTVSSTSTSINGTLIGNNGGFKLESGSGDALLTLDGSTGRRWAIMSLGAAHSDTTALGFYDGDADVAPVNFKSNAIKLIAGVNLGWSSNTQYADVGTTDVGLARNAAGVLEINNGTAGQYRDVLLRTINPNGNNVGIGAAPSELLHATGSGAAKGIKIQTTTSHAAFLEALDGTGRQARLQANVADAFVGTTSNHDFSIVSNGAHIVTVATDGEVGIGDTTPDSLLDVEKSQNAQTAVVVNNPTSGTAARSGLYALNDTGGAIGLQALSSGWTTIGLNMAGFGTVMTDTALSGLVLGTGGAGDPIILGTAQTERVRIDGSGNVGIGDSTPDSFVDVENNQNATTALAVTNTSAGTLARANLSVNNGTGSLAFQALGSGYTPTGTLDLPNYGFIGVDSALSGLAITTGFTDPLIFGTSNAERMRIEGTGNVGIGDTSPAALFTVGSGDLFQVDSSGNLIKIRNVTYSWPSSQGGTSTVLQNNGSGTLSWVAASGLTNLQQAYAASSATGSEIYLDSSRGALTIADSFSSFGGNLFEIQDRTNGAGDYSRRYFTVSATSTNLGVQTLTMSNAGGGIINVTANNDLILQTNSAERLRITGAGNVGVGVTDPDRLFTVGGAIFSRVYDNTTAIQGAEAFVTYNYDTTAGNFSTIRLGDSYIGSQWLNHGTGTSNLVFATANNAASVGARMTVGATSTELTTNLLVTGTAPSFPDVSGAGTRFMYIPNKDGALRAGVVTGTQWNSSNVGFGSVAFGFNTTASDVYAFAGGSGTTASSDYAFAYGLTNTVSGNGGAVFGELNTVGGSNAFSAGDHNSATGSSSVAFGGFNRSGGTYAFSMGSDSTASGNYAFAAGDNVQAYGVESTLFGSDLFTDRTNAILFGRGAGINARLMNDLNDSFMVGFNSTVPTLTVRAASGAGTFGQVGIGTKAPANLFTVGSATSTFEVDAAGNLIKINNIPYSWPSSQGGASTVLTNNGSGVLTWSSAGGGGTLLEAYNSATTTTNSVTELFLNSTKGALTIADQVTGGNGMNNGIGNLFEVQDRTNTAGDYSNRFFTVSSTNTHINYANLAATFVGQPCALGCNVFKVTMPTNGLPVAGEGMAELTYAGNFSSNNNSAMFKITGNNVTSGWGQTIQMNALTTGVGLRVISTSTGMTSGALLSLHTSTTGAISNGAVLLNSSGNYTSTNRVGLLNISSNTTVAGTLFSMSGTSLSSGIMMAATATSLTSGEMIHLKGGTAMTTGSIINVASSTYTVDNAQGNVFNIDFANASAGSGQNAVVGLNINSRFNLFNASAGTKTSAGINVTSPVFTQCRVGDAEQCKWIGALIDGSVDNTLTHTNPDTWEIVGIQIGGEGSYTQSSAAGTFNYDGLLVDMPDATQTAGTMDIYGIHVKAGTWSGGVNKYWGFMVDDDGGTNVAGIDTNGNAYVHVVQQGNSFALCHTTNGTASMQQINDCSGSPSADYMEMYPAADGLAMGDIVMPGTVTVSATNGDEVVQVVKTGGAYEGTMLGVISNPDDAGDFNSIGYQFSDGVHTLPVALKGRVKVKVNMENGAIAVGDPITSSSVAGVGMKSTKPGMIVGQALEAWDGPGQGMILVFMGNGFHSGLAITTDGVTSQFNDDFAFLPQAYADSLQTAIASRELSFVGSAWDAASSTSVTRSITQGLTITDTSSYQLAFKNDDGATIATLNQMGDLALAGTLSVEGGFDYAEMFPAAPDLEAGDIVMVDPSNENGYGVKKTEAAYENTALGVISTKPGFLTGDKKALDEAPVALAGRVPVKVTMENGPIQAGDPIATSSVPGQGMKATEAGRVIGIALQSVSTDGTVLIFVNPSWWNGPTPAEGVLASGTLNITEDSLLDFKNSTISNVAAIISANGSWGITSDGQMIAKKVETETLQAEDVVLVQSEAKAAASEGVIKDGFNAAIVHNPAMKPNSKVFISFLGDPKGGSWVAEKGDGNFTVHLSQPAIGDLPFEYWIVAVDDRRPSKEEEPMPEEEPAPEEAPAPPTESGSGTEETGAAADDSATGTEETGA